MIFFNLRVGVACVVAAVIAMQLAFGEASAAVDRSSRKPNILFIIMDDVGVDQTALIGYGGGSPAPVHVLDQLADAGVTFRNVWSMPECSNGRMAMFTGRYPFRTNVNQAISGKDLANSHVSPFDTTAPRMLKRAGYVSGLFGKYHLGGPEHDPVGDGGPGKRGWDFFYGWTGGAPSVIDTTAGGIAPPGTYSCGYVPTVDRAINGEGANSGACYRPMANGHVSCRAMSVESVDQSLGDSPGLACLRSGGILVPNAACQTAPPSGLKFNVENAYYVSPLVINSRSSVKSASLSDPRARGYRTSIEASSAIRWINQQKSRRAPWMATLSFSSGHVPFQTPPGELLSKATRSNLAAVMNSNAGGTDCNDAVVQRALSNAMIEAMDAEIGRVLVSTGLARPDGAGKLVLNPKSNTMVIVIGDNGSFGGVVKAPFDPYRSKSTPYQTGAWVPMLIAGPLVRQPGRNVGELVNAVDLFGLFGDIAGVDARKAAAPRQIDSKPLLPYLLDSGAASIRTYNFTQGGLNIQPNGGNNGPCVLGVTQTSTGSCSESPFDKQVCEMNGGVWWGPGTTDSRAVQATGGRGVSTCWQVNQSIYDALADKSTYSTAKVSMLPLYYYAARDKTYKYVNTSWDDYVPSNPGVATPQRMEELYEVNESTIPGMLKLDWQGEEIYSLINGVEAVNNLASYPGSERALRRLKDYVAAEFATQPTCTGDGNGDGLVNGADLRGYRNTVRAWSGSSVFDLNYDGQTNSADRQIIAQHIPTNCRPR